MHNWAHVVVYLWLYMVFLVGGLISGREGGLGFASKPVVAS